jgi:hypothetical protein
MYRQYVSVTAWRKHRRQRCAAASACTACLYLRQTAYQCKAAVWFTVGKIIKREIMKGKASAAYHQRRRGGLA